MNAKEKEWWLRHTLHGRMRIEQGQFYRCPLGRNIYGMDFFVKWTTSYILPLSSRWEYIPSDGKDELKDSTLISIVSFVFSSFSFLFLIKPARYHLLFRRSFITSYSHLFTEFVQLNQQWYLTCWKWRKWYWC